MRPKKRVGCRPKGDSVIDRKWFGKVPKKLGRKPTREKTWCIVCQEGRYLQCSESEKDESNFVQYVGLMVL